MPYDKVSDKVRDTGVCRNLRLPPPKLSDTLTNKVSDTGVRGQLMPSPRPWKMIRYFHSAVRNPS